MAYRTTWEPGGFVIEHSGIITGKEVDAVNEIFYSDERSDTARYQIIDCSQVTTVDMGTPDMSRTAAFDLGASRSAPRMQLAFISTLPEMTEAIEQYIEVSKRLNSTWVFEIFEDMASARAWLSA